MPWRHLHVNKRRKPGHLVLRWPTKPEPFHFWQAGARLQTGRGNRVYKCRVFAPNVMEPRRSTKGPQRKGHTVPARFSAQNARTGNFARGPTAAKTGQCLQRSFTPCSGNERDWHQEVSVPGHVEAHKRPEPSPHRPVWRWEGLMRSIASN